MISKVYDDEQLIITEELEKIRVNYREINKSFSISNNFLNNIIIFKQNLKIIISTFSKNNKLIICFKKNMNIIKIVL